MKSTELKQKRAKLIEEAREIDRKATAERRVLHADERRKFDQLLTDAQLLNADIETEERSEAAEREEALRNGVTIADSDGYYHLGRERRAPQRDRFADPYAARLSGRLKPGEVRAIRANERLADVLPPPELPSGVRAEDLDFGRLIRGLASGDWAGAEAERRAMQEGVGPLGGFLVPQPLAVDFIDLARARTVVFQAGARTVPMTSATLKMATLTGDVTVSNVLEGAVIPSSDGAIGARELNAKTLAAATPITEELLQDAPNVGDILRRSITEQMALQLDRQCLRGVGPAEIIGLRNWPSIGKKDLGTNGAALAGYEDFAEAFTQILQANVAPDNISLIRSAREHGEINKMKDTTGQPLAAPPFWAEIRHFWTSAIPTNLSWGTATDASEAYLGDFRSLIVGMRTQLQIELLDQAAHPTTGLGPFTRHRHLKATMRVDAVVARDLDFVVIEGIKAQP